MKRENLGNGRNSLWMIRKLRRKPFEKGLKAGDIRANIREGENTNQKTLHNTIVLAC
jgi:hypothetical protein